MFLFIHRLSQIFIFGTEIHGFFKGTASSALILSRHFVVTACFASSRLSYIFQSFNLTNRDDYTYYRYTTKIIIKCN